MLALALLVGCASRAGVVDRATWLASRGRDAEAITALEAHLTSEPQAHSERGLLIRLYGASGRLDLAAQHAERMAGLLPGRDPRPWLELGRAHELAHRYEEALAAYDRAAAVAPSSAEGPKVGGMRAARWGELELAVPRLEEATRRSGRDAEVWHALGWVRAQLGDLEGARRAYRAGLDADPSVLSNRLGLATVALRSEQPREALREYDALLRERPDNGDMLLGRSWSLILLGDLGEAEATLGRAEARGANAGAVARQRQAIRARRQRQP